MNKKFCLRKILALILCGQFLTFTLSEARGGGGHGGGGHGGGRGGGGRGRGGGGRGRGGHSSARSRSGSRGRGAGRGNRGRGGRGGRGWSGRGGWGRGGWGRGAGWGAWGWGWGLGLGLFAGWGLYGAFGPWSWGWGRPWNYYPFYDFGYNFDWCDGTYSYPCYWNDDATAQEVEVVKYVNDDRFSEALDNIEDKLNEIISQGDRSKVADGANSIGYMLYGLQQVIDKSNADETEKEQLKARIKQLESEAKDVVAPAFKDKEEPDFALQARENKPSLSQSRMKRMNIDEE